ncbi:hypothetical protein NDU88_005443 [Pleurodeles waltl]|uniref:Uncharacterized protein n=1 Tax=Pleurodeles waltl TaxID=8319 RepID=A0AAV7WCQ7_PLEWA|nr:hypothetical protein NDU88_005443 [Pleurodeles waltl]
MKKTAMSLEEAKEDRRKRLMNSDGPSEYRDQRCRTSMPQAAHDVGRIFSEDGKEDQAVATLRIRPCSGESMALAGMVPQGTELMNKQ